MTHLNPATFARPSAPLESLRRATAELCCLLDWGYGRRAALVLVGDRHQLSAADRRAVSRVACTATEAVDRRARQRRSLAECPLIWVDGYNVLTSLHVMALNGPLLRGRDLCARDMAGLHGRWRREASVDAALELLVFCPSRLHWYFDGPVSGSAGEAAAIRRFAARRGLSWTAEVVPDPDPVLAKAPHVIATADAAVLDAGGPWVDLVSAAADCHGAEVLTLFP